MSRTRILPHIATLCALALPQVALADTPVFDSLGSPDQYDPSGGWAITDGPPFGQDRRMAMPFVATGSGTLSSVEIPLSLVSGPGLATTIVDVHLDAGGAPGASLDSSLLTTSLPGYPINPILPALLFPFSGGATLVAGQTYWVVVRYGSPLQGTWMGWHNNVIGDVGNVALSLDMGATWNVMPGQIRAAHRVQVAGSNPSAFCDPNENNSTGMPTRLNGTLGSGLGSGLHLESDQGPPHQFGYFLIGTAINDPGVVFPNSNGRLCLLLGGGHSVGRYNVGGTPYNSLGRFDAGGILQNQVGTSTVGSGYDVPQTVPISGSPAIAVGETWHFQLWHREASGLSNFSNGLSITF